MNLEETVSKIVRQVVEEYVSGKKLTTSVSKNVLILTTRHLQQEETERLASSLSKGVHVSVCGCDQGDADYLKAVEEADIVVAPVLPLAHLSKAALLIDDDPLSAAIIHALLRGKTVIASTSYILPSGADRLSVPPAISETVQSYVQRLAQYGVHWSSRKQLQNSVSKLVQSGRTAQRPLVHAQHVREWVNEGETVIELPDNALLTPLAKEEAKDRGLQWNRKPKGE